MSKVDYQNKVEPKCNFKQAAMQCGIPIHIPIFFFFLPAMKHRFILIKVTKVIQSRAMSAKLVFVCF